MKKAVCVFVMLIHLGGIYAFSLSAGAGYSFQDRKSVMVNFALDSGGRRLKRNNSVVLFQGLFSSEAKVGKISYYNIRFSHEFVKGLIFSTGLGCFASYTTPDIFETIGWISAGLDFPFFLSYRFADRCSLVLIASPEMGIAIPIYMVRYFPLMATLYNMPVSLSLRIAL